jgi:Domain of unknown function (DUF4160)
MVVNPADGSDTSTAAATSCGYRRLARPSPYGGDVAKIEIASGEIIAGTLPGRALRLVREWMELHGRPQRDVGPR